MWSDASAAFKGLKYMKIKHKFFATAAFLMAMTGVATAENHSLWINGMSTSNAFKEGQYDNFSYWGPYPSGNTAGSKPKAVNWDGIRNVGATNGHIRDALDKFCTGNNWCYIAAHSAGNLQIGYALANYGDSDRTKHACNVNGQCKPSGGMQKGWNVKSVHVAGGAAGGSEVAGVAVGLWTGAVNLFFDLLGIESDAPGIIPNMLILRDLVPSTARSLYDHNVTGGVQFHMYAGSNDNNVLTRHLLAGDDDNLVAYHSSGGVAGSSGRPLCNDNKFLCGELTRGTAPNGNSSWPHLIKGGEKWNNHTVAFRDNAGHYPHGSGNGPKVWGGIIGVVRDAMAKFAAP
jgi:hypothetical protein